MWPFSSNASSLNYRKLDDDFVVAGQISPADLPKIAEAARQTPRVVECYRITGEDCFVLKMHGPSIADLEETLDRFLVYGQTTTSIVVSTPVPSRPLPLWDESPDGD